MSYSRNCKAVQALESSLEAVHASHGIYALEDPTLYLSEAILTLRIAAEVLSEVGANHEDAERSWRYATVSERLGKAAKMAHARLNDGLPSSEYYAGQTLLSAIPTIRFGLNA